MYMLFIISTIAGKTLGLLHPWVKCDKLILNNLIVVTYCC